MKKLLVYLKDYKKESILGPLFKLLEASFELLVPLVVTKIIDVGIATGDVHYIVRMVLLMVGLALIGLICSITAQYFAAKAAVGFAAGLKSALFRHIQSLSYSEMDHLGTASLITRMTSDVNQLQSGVNLVLRLFLRSPFIVFGAMVMAFTIDVRSALVFAVAIPLLSVVVFGIMLLTMPLYRRAQAGLDRLLRRTRENLSGVRVIRAFHKEAEETAQFAEENESLTRLQLFVGRISALMNPLTYVLINGAIVALIWTGAWQVERGALTQGQVVALVNYMSQILVELIKLANLIITITKAAACARRIESVFDENSSMTFPGEPAQDDPTAQDAVVFENVALRYSGAGRPSVSSAARAPESPRSSISSPVSMTRRMDVSLSTASMYATIRPGSCAARSVSYRRRPSCLPGPSRRIFAGARRTQRRPSFRSRSRPRRRRNLSRPARAG